MINQTLLVYGHVRVIIFVSYGRHFHIYLGTKGKRLGLHGYAFNATMK